MYKRQIQDDEPKYGLCVTGFVHPDRLWKNYGARPGDVLILTKPLGSGILNTAVKAGLASADEVAEVVRVMAELNRTAKRVLDRYEVHACTDVTGFGLAGHSLEMAKASGVTMDLFVRRVPVMEGAAAYAQMGVIPAGAYQNGDYLLPDMDVTAIVKRKEMCIRDSPPAEHDRKCRPDTGSGELAHRSDGDTWGTYGTGRPVPALCRGERAGGRLEDCRKLRRE